jgi:hypothetical protein
MENLTIRLKLHEVGEFGNAILSISRGARKTITEKTYFHFYNLRSLHAKICIKYLSAIRDQKKKVTLKININEYESFCYYLQTCLDRRIGFDAYYLALITTINGSLDRQRKVLSHTSNFALPE